MQEETASVSNSPWDIVAEVDPAVCDMHLLGNNFTDGVLRATLSSSSLPNMMPILNRYS